MSCQDVVDAAQEVIDGLDHDIPVSLAALAEALKIYRKEKRFSTPDQILEEFTDCISSPAPKWNGSFPDVKRAYKAHANTLNRSVESLTPREKKQAILNVVLEAAE